MQASGSQPSQYNTSVVGFGIQPWESTRSVIVLHVEVFGHPKSMGATGTIHVGPRSKIWIEMTQSFIESAMPHSCPVFSQHYQAFSI